MHPYDYLIFCKIYNLSYSELGCNSCSDGFIAYLESLGYDTKKQWSDYHEKPIFKKPILNLRRNCSNHIDS